MVEDEGAIGQVAQDLLRVLLRDVLHTTEVKIVPKIIVTEELKDQLTNVEHMGERSYAALKTANRLQSVFFVSNMAVVSDAMKRVVNLVLSVLVINASYMEVENCAVN
jgi:hypothetical protein